MPTKKKTPEIPAEYEQLNVVNVRLVKEPTVISDKPVTCQDDAVEQIQELIKGFDREAFCILNLASDGTPLGLNIASIGTLNAALVSPREVFKSSILSNAAAFIAFHCHPSGNPKPSREDARTTQRLKEAGDLLEIKLVDHIIVGCGRDKSFSFQGQGLLDGDSVVKQYNSLYGNRDWER